MTSHFSGWGLAVPPGRVTQEDAAEHAVAMWGGGFDRPGVIPALYRRSGVKSRHSILVETSSGDEPARQSFYHPASQSTDLGPSTQTRMQRYEADATALATAAAHRALESAGVAADAITHLVTVSCTGFAAPGFDLQLIETLPLRRNVVRTHVGFMGCHAAFNGWRVARGFAESDPQAVVLVCCAELCSLHQQYTTDPEQIVANALFADGAAAVVVQASTVPPGADGQVIDQRGWQLIDQQSHVLPNTGNLMTWRIGDHGFQMTLSPRVPEVLQVCLKPWLSEWLARHELTIEDIASWAIHPGGPRILNACEAVLSLPPAALQASRDILERYGNMSSPTIMFILESLQRQQAPTPCVALAFGPGLTIEGALWRSA